MAKRGNQPKTERGGELFIADNSDADWKVLQYLHEWGEIARVGFWRPPPSRERLENWVFRSLRRARLLPEEAMRPNAVPVALMNGEQLCALLIANDICITRRSHDIIEIQEGEEP